MEPSYIVKFHGGGSGVRRNTFDGAIQAAKDRARESNRPARVYRVGAPNVLLATVDRSGVYFTEAGEDE